MEVKLHSFFNLSTRKSYTLNFMHCKFSNIFYKVKGWHIQQKSELLVPVQEYNDHIIDEKYVLTGHDSNHLMMFQHWNMQWLVHINVSADYMFWN
jgi:hypothetical protein